MTDNTNNTTSVKATTNTLRNNIIKLIVISLICIATAILPSFLTDYLVLTPVQHILLVIFVGGALFWLSEPIPVYATSIVIISLLCFVISDSGLTPICNYLKSVDKEHMLSYKAIFTCFSSPVIILFLGGFALAIGATKYKLDVNLANFLLKPFGSNPKLIVLGIMCITGTFGMFMSNTATAVMMLAMIAPVLLSIGKEEPGIKGMVLAIPFAANIGGIATPIGTPPNAIALSYMPENSISFFEWMSIGFPFAVACIFIAWTILCLMFPFKQNRIELDLNANFMKSKQAYIVYVTFAGTILLWMTEKLHGINSYVVALVPILIFTSTGIIKAKDIKTMNWDVIWLVAGGIALGDALSSTKLASVLAHTVDNVDTNAFTIICLLCFIAWLASNFISNTATANLMLPISVAVLQNINLGEGINITHIFVILAFTMSFGMSLPISTPPNALAYATGHIKNIDLLKSGALVSIITFALAIIVLKLFVM
ncbi:MAG: SLC13 family permease [Ruminobacter sp.]|nr:SLC13 family permease [Ruminobacter sp.]